MTTRAMKQEFSSRSRGDENDEEQPRVVKREPGARRSRRDNGEAGTSESNREVFNGSNEDEEDEEQPRVVKREPGGRSRRVDGEAGTSESNRDDLVSRRVLRSRYLTMKTLINVERDDISRPNSDRFTSIFNQVECLHALVKKPREQVADAEALLDIAKTLASSVKTQSNGGATPSDFVSSLLQNFGQLSGIPSLENSPPRMDWRDIGVGASHIFTRFSGCRTMLGPMDIEVKRRKTSVRGRRLKPTSTARPEDLQSEEERRTDTDLNMLAMFDILRKKKRARLENLILNRGSFAQTVENLFTLSFLAKDGRAEIKVDANGRHIVSPRNAPSASMVLSGEASYSHFVFRLDYKDWELMKDSVTPGEELIPHRTPRESSDSQRNPEQGNSQAAAPTTPIRKLCRNRGLVIQEDSVVEDSPEIDYANEAAIRKGKRKLR